ncbi:MAG: DPP IV N-terminal domain-containing protein [Prevotella sp.]|nr:DPP IV N-terminal domain-containing protein [Prevotella sp.]
MKYIFMLAALLLGVWPSMNGAEKMNLKTITSGDFAARTITGLTPVKGTDLYTRISADKKQVTEHSFKTGKQVAVLFDVNHTVGNKIDSFDGYILSPDGTRMLIQTQTEYVYRRSFKAVYYIYNIASHMLQRLSDGGPQQVPVWSPDSRQVAFVRDNNIFLVKLLYDNAECQVTTDGKFNHVINGIPDWVNEEEFGFNCALTFTADGSMLCWLRYDESRVKTYSLQLFRGSHPEHEEYADYPGLYSYKYPKAGQDNSIVSAWSYDIQSHKILKLRVPLDADGYMPRILPTADPNRVVVYTLNRHEDNLNLYTVNPRSALATLLIKESVPKYVKEEAYEEAIIAKDAVILPSDRDGFMKLYVYNMNGQLQRTVGVGAHDVTDVYGYDEATGDVYFQAAAPNPHERQLFVGRRNGKVEQLSDKAGTNSAFFSADFKYFVRCWSDYDTPYVFAICDNKGKEISTLEDNKELRQKVADCGWTKKETFSFTTSEGVKLDGWMIKPADFDPSKKYPVILFQYSGPGSQQVKNSWAVGSMGNGGAFDYYLAEQGFIVACVDGRGTGFRGSDFEKCIYLKMGDLESKDQVETALWLGQQSYVDKNRIGIWGWSFGGFNTLMSMSEGRPVFKAGVAVAPPTNWKFYDTIYTERYMRTPKENPDGYALNPIVRAPKLHGALLICHGMADDNVHPQNTFEYAEALVQADKDFKENYYTNRNHSIYGGNTRNHLLRQIANFFVENLK